MVNPRRVALIVYAVVLAGFGVAAGAVLLDARAQYRQLRQIEQVNRQKLADAQARLREQERNLERLKTDPEFVSRAIRERLRYGKPDEVIFRFPN
jgi:cell division protein FtsB